MNQGRRVFYVIIPAPDRSRGQAPAGIQVFVGFWTPAYAGVTGRGETPRPVN